MVKTLEAMPEFMNSGDLVELGLYTNRDAVYCARLKGISPDFIKLGRRILFPKNSVVAFIDCHMKKGNYPNLLPNNINQSS